MDSTEPHHWRHRQAFLNWSYSPLIRFFVVSLSKLADPSIVSKQKSTRFLLLQTKLTSPEVTLFVWARISSADGRRISARTLDTSLNDRTGLCGRMTRVQRLRSLKSNEPKRVYPVRGLCPEIPHESNVQQRLWFSLSNHPFVSREFRFNTNLKLKSKTNHTDGHIYPNQRTKRRDRENGDDWNVKRQPEKLLFHKDEQRMTNTRWIVRRTVSVSVRSWNWRETFAVSRLNIANDSRRKSAGRSNHWYIPEVIASRWSLRM